jgi:hypothetical protein
MTRSSHTPAEPIAFAIGLGVACVSLALGFVAGGPLVRAFLGPPLGFGEDYTTWQGVAQSIFAQGFFLIPAFFCCGYSLGNLLSSRRDWSAAVVIANPINVLVGYWLCYKLLHTGRDLHAELLYFRVSSAGLWILMSVVLLAPAAHVGLRLRQRTMHTRAV